MSPLAAGDAPQRVNSPYHQPVRVVVVAGFAPFTIQIGGDAGVIIVAEAVTPVAAGGGGAEHPATPVVGN
ncbi:hypothetical protein [Xenorhabdus bovienii]|uniref:hypothetical protein n=1 Tax=Xenorhabdus bovienii TaxID=40576 RepID=UPI003F68470B